ncbi:MAG: TetR/AcrR family transcriptional regulator [Porphyromonadaceae bacterium]|nr:TetR/AcrR family transcriptional regulator [Porphyromonadaceae bacterium]
MERKGKTAPEKRVKNREQAILEAAEALFLEQGFEKTSTMQIAERAGCNQALIHYYYRKKENLFERILEEKMQFLLENFTNIHAMGGTLEEKVVKIVEFHFDFLQKNSLLIPFLLGEVLSNGKHSVLILKKVRQAASLFVGKIDKMLQGEVDKGNTRPITTIDFILTILSLDVTPFILRPIIQQMLRVTDAQMEQQLAVRKGEILETILSRLRR